MSKRLLVLPLFAWFVLSGAVSAVRGDTKDDELKKMKGTWTIVSATKDGEPMPEKDIKDSTFVIDGDTMSMNKGDRKDPATVKSVDPSKSPAWIDVAGGPETIQGIYKIDGDSLEICLKLTGRPTDFKGGKDTVYLKLKRQK